MPFDFVADTGDTDARLGGRPPIAVHPPEDSGACYFATIPLTLEPIKHVSIFIPQDGEMLFDGVGTISGPGMLSFVVHDPAPRVLDHGGALDSPLSERSLAMREEKDDWFYADDGTELIEQRHKLGGRPYLLRHYVDPEAVRSELDDQGFFQIAQLGFPAKPGDLAVAGTWPFGDGFVHFFARPPFGVEDWRWFWEF